MDGVHTPFLKKILFQITKSFFKKLFFGIMKPITKNFLLILECFTGGFIGYSQQM